MRAFGWPVFGSVWGADGGSGPGPVSLLQPFYDSDTIGIHLRRDGATPPGGPVTAIANEGGAGALFDATVVGTPIPLTGNYLESTTTTGYPVTANPADLVGVRLMWVMRMNSATGTYRFFGRTEGADTLYIRTNNGTSIQMFRVVGGVTTTASFTGITATTAPRMLEIETTSSAARLFINGVLHQEVAVSFPYFRIDRILQGPTALQAFEGGMGDVLGVVTGQADTDGAIEAVRYYLDQRFALGLGFEEPASPAARQATAMYVGAVTTDSLMVSAYTEDGASTMQAFAVPVGGGAEIAGPSVAVSAIEAVNPATLYPSANYGVARGSITGLSPDVEYDIGIRVDGQVTPGIAGRARTRPTVRRPFTFGFGTCFEMNTTRTYANFDTMAAQDLEFFAVLDDRGYADITTNDPRLYYRADWGYLHHPRIGPFHRAFPIYNVPGDHDFGADNSNAASAGKPAFMQWYRNHAPQPVTLTGALDPVDYAVWIAPGLKLVMADTRTNRSGNMFMDAAQEARLIAHIQEVGAIPDAAMIWNSGTPWISGSDNDTWFGAAAQRQRIADAVLQYAPGRVAIICGDMHALAFDDGSNSAGGMPVFHAAPMARANSSKGGPYSGGSPVQATQTQYGQMDCTPVTGGWQLDFRGYSCDATTGAQTLRLSGSATLVEAEVVDPPEPSATYQEAVLATSPQFLLMNPSGATIPDETGNGRSGAIVGTQGTQVPAGPFGLPAFRGTTSCHVQVAHDAAFNGTSWSVAFFIHPNGQGSPQYLGYFHRGGSQKLAITFESAALLNTRYSSTNTLDVADITDPANWNFVVMTFDAATGTGRTYSARNGGALSLRSENTVAGSSHTTTDPIVFNGRVEGGTASRRGATAHAGMARWDRVLSLAEIEAIYSSAQAGA